jgi:hypothetical protein
MPNTKTITLLDPFDGHGGKVTEVVLREPRGRDFIELGDPFVYARTEDKMIVSAENDVAIKGYIERCIEKPNVLLVMSQLSLVDMMAIKEAILQNFMDARRALSAGPAKS